MISFEEALDIVVGSCVRSGTERLHFSSSLNRILAEDVLSDLDMPPFNRAAVDGYACSKKDIYSGMEVIETVQAGQVPVKKPAKGQCTRIMTGSIVPEGCDMVFMVEDSLELSPGKVKFTGSSSKSNISLKGEDVRAGDRVLPGGIRIRPQDIAVMASVGHTDVLVSRKPAIGILSTGDELVEPSEKPALSQIRNSNAPQLVAQVERAGGLPRYYGIAPDNEEITYNMVAKAIDENEIVILTGGVSMGDFDFVPGVLMKAGVKILFDKIRIQPGKPTTFGIHEKAVVFGLPGNPVSSFVQFETLVRPLINLKMGHDWKPRTIILPMEVDYRRRSADRAGWIPVTISGGDAVRPVDYHGSAHISSIPMADGIIPISTGCYELKKGEKVELRLI